MADKQIKQIGYIKKLYLRNFRRFKKADIEFKSEFNFLVGPNNAGKSTILQAIDILFGEKNLSPEKVEDAMFNNDVASNDRKFFTIAAEIEYPKCGSGDKEINIVKSLKISKGSSRSSLPNYVLTEKLNINSIIDERININNENSSFSDNIGKDNKNIDSSKFYFICDVQKESEENVTVEYFLFVEAGDTNGDNFNGLKIFISPYQLKRILNFLLVPAGRSENNQLFKVESYTWLGDYLRRIQENKIEDVKKYFSEGSRNFPIQVNDNAQSILNEILPNLERYKIEIDCFNNKQSDQLYKYSHFFIEDPAHEEIYYKGHGIQSAVAMSLFGDYLNIQCNKQISNTKTSNMWAAILALEEPESHFHPPVRIRLSKVLKKKFVDLGAQVIISTHDETFPKWPKINNSNLIFPNSIKEGTITTKNFEGNNNDIERMMRFMSSTFYGNKVIIVEGREADCLNAVFDNLLNEDLSDNGIGIVQATTKARSDRIHDEPSGGVDDIVNMIELYKDLDIKVACLIDADVIFCKVEALKKIYEKMIDQELSIDTSSVISDDDLSKIKKFCKQCNNCAEGVGRSIINYIKEQNKIDEYKKLIQPLNSAGIYFFNEGDFEANFKIDFVSNNLNGDGNKINREKLVYAVKYKAETEVISEFKNILSDNAEQDLEENFKSIKNFMENGSNAGNVEIKRLNEKDISSEENQF